MEQQMSITALSVVDDQNIPTDAVDLIVSLLRITALYRHVMQR